ncbi:MAG TPA: gamma-glutamylcyclotransferase [Alphaproteobacteria bacterium]|nr:gamma-glutamylcyclotransferase [Alphaproteobacteria bacterium]
MSSDLDLEHSLARLDVERDDYPRAPTIRIPPGEGMWVFAYGSLMWNPGFPHLERQQVLLRGYHRRFCVYSHRYRGTPERPGLVLGLDRGGSCRGIAFRVAPPHVDATLAYLWEREMVTGVYRPTLLTVRSPRGAVKACSFVVDRRHRQYCGQLALERTVDLIAQGVGQNGPNWEYLVNTVEHLEEIGVRDRALRRLADRVQARRADMMETAG